LTERVQVTKLGTGYMKISKILISYNFNINLHHHFQHAELHIGTYVKTKNLKMGLLSKTESSKRAVKY